MNNNGDDELLIHRIDGMQKMPAFERVRDQFLKRLEEEEITQKLIKNFQLSTIDNDNSHSHDLNTFYQKFLQYGYQSSNIDEALQKCSCYSTKFDGDIESINFIDIFLHSLCKNFSMSELHYNCDKFSSADFVWPLIDMAEFEFLGNGTTSDMRNVIILNNLPELSGNRAILFENLLVKEILTFFDDVEVVSVHLPGEAGELPDFSSTSSGHNSSTDNISRYSRLEASDIDTGNRLKGCAFICTSTYDQAVTLMHYLNGFPWPISGSSRDLSLHPTTVTFCRWQARLFRGYCVDMELDTGVGVHADPSRFRPRSHSDSDTPPLSPSSSISSLWIPPLAMHSTNEPHSEAAPSCKGEEEEVDDDEVRNGIEVNNFDLAHWDAYVSGKDWWSEGGGHAKQHQQPGRHSGLDDEVHLRKVSEPPAAAAAARAAQTLRPGSPLAEEVPPVVPASSPPVTPKSTGSTGSSRRSTGTRSRSDARKQKEDSLDEHDYLVLGIQPNLAVESLSCEYHTRTGGGVGGGGHSLGSQQHGRPRYSNHSDVESEGEGDALTVTAEWGLDERLPPAGKQWNSESKYSNSSSSSSHYYHRLRGSHSYSNDEKTMQYHSENSITNSPVTSGGGRCGDDKSPTPEEGRGRDRDYLKPSPLLRQLRRARRRAFTALHELAASDHAQPFHRHTDTRTQRLYAESSSSYTDSNYLQNLWESLEGLYRSSLTETNILDWSQCIISEEHHVQALVATLSTNEENMKATHRKIQHQQIQEMSTKKAIYFAHTEPRRSRQVCSSSSSSSSTSSIESLSEDDLEIGAVSGSDRNRNRNMRQRASPSPRSASDITSIELLKKLSRALKEARCRFAVASPGTSGPGAYENRGGLGDPTVAPPLESPEIFSLLSTLKSMVLAVHIQELKRAVGESEKKCHKKEVLADRCQLRLGASEDRIDHLMNEVSHWKSVNAELTTSLNVVSRVEQKNRMLVDRLVWSERARQGAEERLRAAESRQLELERLALTTAYDRHALRFRSGAGAGAVTGASSRSWYDQSPSVVMDDEKEEEVATQSRTLRRQASTPTDTTSVNTTYSQNNSTLSSPNSLIQKINDMKNDSWVAMDFDDLQRSQAVLDLALGRIKDAMEVQLQNKIREEERRKKREQHDMESQTLCCICRESPKTILLLPCRHLCVCEGCITYENMDKCPVCRGTVVQQLKVFA